MYMAAPDTPTLLRCLQKCSLCGEPPRRAGTFPVLFRGDDDDELNTNPPTPCLGKRPQRPKPKGPGRPWGQKPLAHGRTVEGVCRGCHPPLAHHPGNVPYASNGWWALEEETAGFVAAKKKLTTKQADHRRKSKQRGGFRSSMWPGGARYVVSSVVCWAAKFQREKPPPPSGATGCSEAG